jgi:hypothetical protein
MYLEGIGFRCIGRVLDISYGTVFQWIKKAGKAASPTPKTEDVQVMELDEMHTYVGKKTTDAGMKIPGGLPLTCCGLAKGLLFPVHSLYCTVRSPLLLENPNVETQSFPPFLSCRNQSRCRTRYRSAVRLRR